MNSAFSEDVEDDDGEKEEQEDNDNAKGSKILRDALCTPQHSLFGLHSNHFG